MSVVALHPYRAAPRSDVGAPALLRRVMRGASAFLEHRARERSIAHGIRQLRTFDDRMLADIGLTRTDIEGGVRRTTIEAMPCRRT